MLIDFTLNLRSPNAAETRDDFGGGGRVEANANGDATTASIGGE
jgi:hypothetical protein